MRERLEQMRRLDFAQVRADALQHGFWEALLPGLEATATAPSAEMSRVRDTLPASLSAVAAFVALRLAHHSRLAACAAGAAGAAAAAAGATAPGAGGAGQKRGRDEGRCVAKGRAHLRLELLVGAQWMDPNGTLACAAFRQLWAGG